MRVLLAALCVTRSPAEGPASSTSFQNWDNLGYSKFGMSRTVRT